MSAWQPFPAAANGEDKRGLLHPNATREHHFIAQTEQRMYAFNPQVSEKNRNIYRFEVSPRHGRITRAHSVNIENNLEGVDLYLLQKADDGMQYNLEAWFNRYESAYDFGLAQLLALPAGRRPYSTAYEAVWHMKLLDILRNPYLLALPVGQYLHRCLKNRLPLPQAEINALAEQIMAHSGRNQYRPFGLSVQQYGEWLAVLCAALSEAVAKPSVFECFAADWLNLRAGVVRHALFRYRQQHCFLNDMALCAQYGAALRVFGTPLAAQAFMTVEIADEAWKIMPDLAAEYRAPQGDFGVMDGNEHVRHFFNRRMRGQCHAAVYGQSEHVSDYG